MPLRCVAWPKVYPVFYGAVMSRNNALCERKYPIVGRNDAHDTRSYMVGKELGWAGLPKGVWDLGYTRSIRSTIDTRVIMAPGWDGKVLHKCVFIPVGAHVEHMQASTKGQTRSRGQELVTRQLNPMGFDLDWRRGIDGPRNDDRRRGESHGPWSNKKTTSVAIFPVNQRRDNMRERYVIPVCEIDGDCDQNLNVALPPNCSANERPSVDLHTQSVGIDSKFRDIQTTHTSGGEKVPAANVGDALLFDPLMVIYYNEVGSRDAE
ncbi:hypothetical protein K438DRAFT_1821136 [Mycena galopus ATCC 62051]|nr:hypothetical protein K438DRAFT_1821136 [Mycena galopus ATCC 62051]